MVLRTHMFLCRLISGLLSNISPMASFAFVLTCEHATLIFPSEKCGQFAGALAQQVERKQPLATAEELCMSAAIVPSLEHTLLFSGLSVARTSLGLGRLLGEFLN